MELKQLIARVNRATPNLPPGSIGTNDIIDLLNEGQLNLANMSHKTALKKYELEDGYDAVPFPEDKLKIVNVYWSEDKRKLEAGAGSVPDSGEWATEPRIYYMMSSAIMLRPVPRTGDSVYVEYIPKPVPMEEDGDEPELDGADEYIVAYALHRLHLEGNSPGADTWDRERARALALFLETHDQEYQAPFKILPLW